jgi:hypothetical protein
LFSTSSLQILLIIQQMCVEAALIIWYWILSKSCCLECSGFSEPIILVQISFALLHWSEWVRTIDYGLSLNFHFHGWTAHWAGWSLWFRVLMAHRPQLAQGVIYKLSLCTQLDEGIFSFLSTCGIPTSVGRVSHIPWHHLGIPLSPQDWKPDVRTSFFLKQKLRTG